MSKVYISLGTNLGNKKYNLSKACNHISNQVGKIQQKSSIYETEPWGFDSFNNFLNQVVLVETEVKPKELLKSLLKIEKDMGRYRTSDSSYQDRIIDIDIIMIDDMVINDKSLKVPHPKMHLRMFVLEPLIEINETLFHPTYKKTMKQLLAELTKNTDTH